MIFTILFLACSIPSIAAPTCGTEEGKALSQAAEEMWRGDGTRVEVAQAEVALKKARLDCGVISRLAYCSTSNKLSQLVLESAKEEFAYGRATPKDLQKAQDTYAQFQAFCSSK